MFVFRKKYEDLRIQYEAEVLENNLLRYQVRNLQDKLATVQKLPKRGKDGRFIKTK